MLHYILQIVAFQVMFLLVYDVFLKRETFFNYNRIYLLGTAILSFILPFVKIDSIQAVAPKDFVVLLPEVIIGNLNPPTELERKVALQTGIDIAEPSQPIWQIIFIAGMALATLIFLFKISKVLWLKSQNPRRWQGNVLIVRLLKSTSAFSFFNTIFIGEEISSKETPTILEHELVHVKQWHSLDLMLFEAMRIVLWFNPLIYMYQNRVKALHEFIADETTAKQSGKKSYYQQLLNQVFETQNLSFTNTFYNKSLIKKRIVMLQKSKSKKINLVKYALIIPFVFGMLLYVACDKEVSNDEDIILEQVSEETDLKNGVITEIEEINPRDFDNKSEVPFGIIDQVPVFESCLSVQSEDERRDCVSREVSTLVMKNFKTDLAEKFGLTGRQRISLAFKINKEGDVEEVKARAPHPGLEDEAKRVIKMLPKMIPGKHNGQTVTVPYSLPIIFQVQSK